MKIWKLDVNFGFKWYDFWVGFYWDRYEKVLYFIPFPMCVFSFKRHVEIVFIELDVEIPIEEIDITLIFDEEKGNGN